MVLNNCNNDRLNKQKEFLENEIVNGTNKDRFKVINLECGTGKSKTANKIFLKCYDKGILYVKQRNSDVDSDVAEINSLAGEDSFAYGVYSKKYKSLASYNEDKKRFYLYPVLVITHERYKSLCRNSSERKFYTAGRQVLVIDEFIDMANCNIISIDRDSIDEFEIMLKDRTIRSAYIDAMHELLDFFLKSESKKEKRGFYNFKGDMYEKIKQVNKVSSLINSNLAKEHFKNYSLTKTDVIEKLNKMKQFFNQTCVVDKDKLYCTDRRYGYFMLENNIILDATANVNMAYKLNDTTFEIANQSRVLDHCKWKFTVFLSNTTSSAKKKAINYDSTINKLIESVGKEDTLFISNKLTSEEAERVDAKYINHFGNITGSNEYRDLKNVIIAHTPNLPYYCYVLEYLYHSNKDLDGMENWRGSFSGKGEEKVYRFANKEFEDYRVNKNVEQMYQAIKRVNRSMEGNSIVQVLCNDSRCIDKLRKMFKHSNEKDIFTVYSSVLEYEKSEKAEAYNEKRKEDSYASKFVRLCEEILNHKHKDLQKEKKNRKKELVIEEGIFSKKKIAEYLDVDVKNLKKLIFNKVDVVDYMKRHNIIEKGQGIDFRSAKR